MGDKFKNLIKTAGQENAEAKEQYEELLKVGNIIGEGFMDVVLDKEAGLKGAFKAVKGKAGKGKEWIGGKLKKAKGSKPAQYVGGKAKATKKYVGGKAEVVDVKAQALGEKVYRKTPFKKKPGAISKKKKRIYGYGAAGAVGGAAYGAGKKYKITKRASDDDVKTDDIKTAADLIVRYHEEEE